MKTDLFHLEILPIDRIVEHEVFDVRRMEPILARLQEEKKLVNPILVAPMSDGRYLQLDGMNRLSAFRKLQIPTIAAQIVDYGNDEQVKLFSWMHLYRITTQELLSALRSAQVTTGHPARIQMPDFENGWVATIQPFPDLSTGTQSAPSISILEDRSDKERARTILGLVQSYESAGIVRERVPDQLSADSLMQYILAHADTHGSILFPKFTKKQIIALVKDGGLLPAGITRHVVKNRCLNVNVPIALMADSLSLEEKNNKLDVLLSSRAVRRYEEPVVYIE